MRHLKYQRGLSLSGLIVGLAVCGAIGVVAMKVVPTFSEYRSILGAIKSAKAAGTTIQEIKASFDKSADTNYVTVISSKDLIITKESGEFEVSFAYESRIPLAGPVSLVIDYAGSTAKGGPQPAKMPQ